MNKNNLLRAESKAKKQLVKAIMKYVRENGEEMSEYFYNEFGMNEEDDGEKIIKVLDVSGPGCCFSCQNKANDSMEIDLHNMRHTPSFIYWHLNRMFYHCAIWAFYIVKDTEGKERLKYYMFHNEGTQYEEDSEPDHDYVDNLGLQDLHYIIEAITEN